MQLCDTGREIKWSIRSRLCPGLGPDGKPDLGPNRSDEFLDALLDTEAATLIWTFPKENNVAHPEIHWPIEQESMASAVRRGFWPVVVVSFAAICGVVTLLIARLWQ